MDLDAYLGSGQPPEAKKLVQAMLGDTAAIEVYLAAANPTTVVGAYISQKQLSRAVQAANDPNLQLSGDPGVQKTAAMLPGDAQWVGFWSPRGTFQFVSRTLAAIVPDEPPPLPEFPETSPLGFAAKLAPDRADTVLVVPADVIQAAVNLIKRVTAPPE
jgi:hypothetical protein